MESGLEMTSRGLFHRPAPNRQKTVIVTGGLQAIGAERFWAAVTKAVEGPRGEIHWRLVAAGMLVLLGIAIRNSWSIAITIVSSQE
jgi:hypothetical protein